MINREELNQFSETTRNRLLEAFALNEVTTMALGYALATADTLATDSRCGGAPLISNPNDWPLDKNRKPMQFWAQINFEQMGGIMGGLKNCPRHGVLMLFVSRDYRSFKPKEQGWYRLVFRTDGLDAELVEALADPHSAYELKPERLEYVPPERLHSAAAQIDPGERDAVEAWLQGWKGKIDCRLSDCQQVLGIESMKAREALIIAAFHANGITYDLGRRADSHYSHLVDAAEHMVVVWRLGGIQRLVTNEKRELFICMTYEDLINSEFQRSLPVWL
jgi:hypothetical protein